MKITLTSMQGNTRNINLASKQEVYNFIDLYKSTLLPSQRVKITCDLLGIDGYLQGEIKIQRISFLDLEAGVGGNTFTNLKAGVVGTVTGALLFCNFTYDIVYRTRQRFCQKL